MKDLLRYINSMPFPFTIKHYYAFGMKNPALTGLESSTPEAWDALRDEHPHFQLPETREEWLQSLNEKRDGQDGGMRQRAVEIARAVRALGSNSLFSIGAGSAGLEYFIAQEGIMVTATEYSPRTVERLRKVFTEGSVRQFDVLHDSIESIPRDAVVLMSRMDPQLSNHEWRAAFRRLRWGGVKNIIYVPSNMLTIMYMFNEMKHRILRPGSSFAGYLRTKATFRSYWKGLYRDTEAQFGGIKSFILTG